MSDATLLTLLTIAGVIWAAMLIDLHRRAKR